MKAYNAIGGTWCNCLIVMKINNCVLLSNVNLYVLHEVCVACLLY